jgi:hypothetical protein
VGRLNSLEHVGKVELRTCPQENTSTSRSFQSGLQRRCSVYSHRPIYNYTLHYTQQTVRRQSDRIAFFVAIESHDESQNDTTSNASHARTYKPLECQRRTSNRTSEPPDLESQNEINASDITAKQSLYNGIKCILFPMHTTINAFSPLPATMHTSTSYAYTRESSVCYLICKSLRHTPIYNSDNTYASNMHISARPMALHISIIASL